MLCHHCQETLKLTSNKVGRTEACPKCDADMHVCLNCALMDPFAPNQCREPQAELVRDKERANFCDYFEPNQKCGGMPGKSAKSKEQEARNAFDNLFKKN